MLRITNLSFEYKSKMALSNINLLIHDGDFLLLTGANGSGKTTLLKILSGLLPIQSGRIFHNTEELSQKDLKMLCGYVFHNPVNQIIGSTVEEDVAFGLENMGIARIMMHEEVEKILRKFELYKFRDEDPMNLSAGQAQKLVVASIAVLKPKYLFLDEPTSMLDDKGCQQVKEVIQLLNRIGVAIVISTHEIHLFADLAKRIVHLSNGRIDFDGSIADFINSDIDDVEE